MNGQAGTGRVASDWAANPIIGGPAFIFIFFYVFSIFFIFFFIFSEIRSDPGPIIEDTPPPPPPSRVGTAFPGDVCST